MCLSIFFFSSLSLVFTSLYLIVLLLRYGKEKVHKIFLLFNISILIWSLGATLASMTRDQNLANIFWRLGCGGVSFTAIFTLHMAQILTKANSKIILFFSYLHAIFSDFLLFKTDLLLTTPQRLYHNTFFLKSVSPHYYPFYFFPWIIFTSYALFLLVRFYLKKQEKNIKYLVTTLAIAFSCGALNFLSPFGIPIFEYGNFGIAIYCLTVSCLILRGQFIGIEIIYRKSLLYSMLVAILSAIYLILVVVTEWLFKGFLGYHSLFLSLTLTFIIALLFNPLKDRIQTFIDRKIIGKTPQEIAKENELLKREVEHSERLKVASTLALGLTHEIKNPLTTLKTFAEFLPAHFDDKEFLAKFSKIIPGEIERINGIIQQLLQFSKPQPPRLSPVDIRPVLQETLLLLKSECLKRKITLIEDYDGVALIVKGDAVQLKQAFLNILLNALESMTENGTITVRAGAVGDSTAKIEISDTGCGIAPKDLPHLFDPFFSKKDKGSGLGLAVTHQIIKNHKGRIHVSSEAKQGTTFTIQLPLDKITDFPT